MRMGSKDTTLVLGSLTVNDSSVHVLTVIFEISSASLNVARFHKTLVVLGKMFVLLIYLTFLQIFISRAGTWSNDALFSHLALVAFCTILTSAGLRLECYLLES